MARPTKERRIEFIPENKYFKPAGVPMRNIKEVSLTLEEVEAVRLKDMEELNQEECASRMNISRPTFQRVLIEARRKIADALITGKAIRFHGGDYKLADKYFHCSRCGERYNKAYQNRRRRGRTYQKYLCPECDE